MLQTARVYTFAVFVCVKEHAFYRLVNLWQEYGYQFLLNCVGVSREFDVQR